MKSFTDAVWNSKWGLSIMAGVLLGLSFPPVPLPFLLFPAFLLVFRLTDLSSSAREAAYRSYPAFVIWNLITTYWLMMASLAAGIAAILANAVLMTLPVMLQFKVQKKFHSAWIISLLQTAFWVSYEYLNHQWQLAWPWLSLGNAWSNVPNLIQYISATGYLGISFWVVLTSALAYQAIKHGRRSAAYYTVAVALLFPVISLIQLPFISFPSSGSPVETVVAQPNFDSYHTYGGFSTPQAAVNMLVDLTDSVRTDRTQLIVWPENGIYPSLSNRRLSNNRAANEAKSLLTKKASLWNTTLIGGTGYYEFYDASNTPPLARGSGNNRWHIFNAAVAFYADSSTDVYRKHNLVPIVERIPYVHFLNAIDVFNWVAWKDVQGFGKSYDPDQFNIAQTRTPALICYDSVFPGWIRKFVQNGAGFITIITNDGWWGKTSGHAQHFAYARLRAIEFRRWIVRSANNGISGIISPGGSVKVETDYWKRMAFRYDVPVLTESTLYTKYGDWLPIVMVIISVAGMVLVFIPAGPGFSKPQPAP